MKITSSKKKALIGSTKKILSYIKKCIDEQAKVVIFPECSIPRESIKGIKKIAEEKKVMIIGGLEYNEEYQNKYLVVTQEGTVFEGVKIHASKYDHPNMASGNEINILINTGFGDFAPVICYDFTDFSLISDLKGYLDIIVILANNPDIKTFHSEALRICWESFCFVAICNNGIFGGSGVFGPINKINETFVDKTLWKTEGVVETLGCVNLPIAGLLGGGRYDKYCFKNPPAGYERKRLYPSLVFEKKLNRFVREVEFNPASYLGFVNGQALLIQLLNSLGFSNPWELTANKKIQLRTFDVKHSDFFGNTVFLPVQYSACIRESLRKLIGKTAKTRSEQPFNFRGIVVTGQNMGMIPFHLAPFIFEEKPTLSDVIKFYELNAQEKREALIFKQLKERGYSLGLPMASFGNYMYAIWLLHYESQMMLAQLRTVDGNEDEYQFYYCLGEEGLIIVFSDLIGSVRVIEDAENVTGRKVIEVWSLRPEIDYIKGDRPDATKEEIEKFRSFLLKKYNIKLLM